MKISTLVFTFRLMKQRCQKYREEDFLCNTYKVIIYLQMTQHIARNNKMETGAQHNNSRDTCSLSVLSERTRCYQENGTYLPNFHHTATGEYYNPDTLANLCCPWLEPEEHSQYCILTTSWAGNTAFKFHQEQESSLLST